MTTLSKNKSVLLAGAFLFFATIIFFSSVSAQVDGPLQDAPHDPYILAQATKPAGQQRISQAPVTGKPKPGATSGKSSTKSKTVATDDDDDDDDDDDEDTPPAKVTPAVPSTPSQKATTPPPPAASAPSALPAQAPPKPSAPPAAQAPAVKPVPSNNGQPSVAPPQPAQQQVRPQPAKPAPAARGSISLNFDDADVYQVIQTIFGDVLRVNYIVDPRVKGRVTFRSIAPIPTDQVLPVMETILRINGIGVVEDGGLYRVVPISEVAREPASVGFGRDPDKIPSTGKSLVQVVPILFLQSSEVIKLITPFLSATAVIIDVPKTNQVIIVDTDASVKRILQFLATFDNEQQKKKQAQVYVYSVQNGKAKNVANLLQQIFLGARSSTTSTAPAPATTPTTPKPPTTPQTPRPPATQQQPSGPSGSSPSEALVSDLTRIFADDILNSVIILATPEDYALIKETIAKIDLQPRQVMIEGLVAQITLTDNFSLGMAYAFKTQFKISGDSVMKGLIGLNTGTLNAESIPGSGFTFVGTVGDDVRAVINALATQSRAKVIAAPHILVTDNREARIQVGQQVPIVTSETYGSTTVAPQRTIQYKDIGIILKVTPQVNEGGLVSLDVAQEVSTFSTIELGIADKTIILNKAEATTNVVVKDGETIVIGGLIREDTSKSRTGVPWLTKIPILGYLFGNTTDDDSRQEIIVLLTPRVIKTQSEAKEVTSDYVDRMTKTGKGKVTTQELFGPGGPGVKRGQQVLSPDTGAQQSDEPSKE
jgi:type II secretory pathway component GspD/PulD (secretin)